MFLQQRYSNLKLQTAGRWLRTIGLDLTYLEDYNPRYPAVLHTLKNPAEMETGKTVTLTWNAEEETFSSVLRDSENSETTATLTKAA